MQHLHPYFEDFNFIGFVHRGGAEETIENTLEAFKHSADLGFTYMETDVQSTKDGKIVIFHDSNLERMTGVNKKIADISYKDIKKISIKGESNIPSLNELLSNFKQLRFNIDIKTDLAVENTLKIIKDHDAFNRVCLAAFSSKRLDKIRKLTGSRCCTSMGTKEVINMKMGSLGLPVKISVGNCAQVPISQWGIKLVTSNFINYLKKQQKLIHVWTIDEEEEMKRLISLGVNGVMTDKPKVLKKVLEKLDLM